MVAQYRLKGKRVWVAGHRGLVGSAVVRALAGEGCTIVKVTRDVVDLRCQRQVDSWIAENRPDAVFLCAATVGGIVANDTRPAEFLTDNVLIAANVIKAAYEHGTEKLLYLGSSCIYPRLAPQPMPETALLSGALEPTNQWYGIAKIAGLKMCEAYRRQYSADFISAMPTNLYGPDENFDLKSSHVIPALMRKAHEAKLAGSPEVTVWGTGAPRREFLYVDDLASALIFLMKNYSSGETINVGVGRDVSIRELAETVCRVVEFKGKIAFDSSKPDGTMRKLLDVSRLTALGWRAGTKLEDGLSETYSWFVANRDLLRAGSRQRPVAVVG